MAGAAVLTPGQASRVKELLNYETYSNTDVSKNSTLLASHIQTNSVSAKGSDPPSLIRVFLRSVTL